LVLGELLRPAQVDDPRDPVVGEGAPTRTRELANVVGTDNPAGNGPRTILGRQPAKVADVHAAVPVEVCHRPQLREGEPALGIQPFYL
jgi:hypothetical protein